MLAHLFDRKLDITSATRAAGRRSLAMIEFDLDGVVLDANEVFLKLMGYDLEEVKGKHHRMFVEETARESPAYSEFWQSLRLGEHRVAQFKRIAKGGREVWMEGSYSPVLGSDGKPIRVVKIASDVTAEKTLHMDLLGQVTAINRSNAVIEFDVDGTIRTANEKSLNLLGYELADVVGQHHRIFVEPEYRSSQEYLDFWAELRRGEYKSARFKRIGRGGKVVWIQASYNPIFDLAGRLTKVVKYAVDVTLTAGSVQDLDHNFSEIDGAIGRSTEQACAAAISVSETTSGVQIMAASTEQLASSVREIADTMVRSKSATDTAHAETKLADDATQRLSAASKSMEGMVELIRSIAGQINLLALNATIESARAGEAGKGFAVVASEVKNLASQARSATDQISQEITSLRVVSDEVVAALGVIKKSIDTVRDYVTGTASAVEEQSAVTQDLSLNMQRTAASVVGINDNMNEITAAVSEAAQAAGTARRLARQIALG